MINTISFALSGLLGAAKKAAIAADNIVNSDSEGVQAYQPRDVAQTSGPGGVQQSTIVLRTPGVIAGYGPDSPFADGKGYVMQPNVDTTKEMMTMQEAKLAYTANAIVLSRVQELQDALKYNKPSLVNEQA